MSAKTRSRDGSATGVRERRDRGDCGFGLEGAASWSRTWVASPPAGPGAFLRTALSTANSLWILKARKQQHPCSQLSRPFSPGDYIRHVLNVYECVPLFCLELLCFIFYPRWQTAAQMLSHTTDILAHSTQQGPWPCLVVMLAGSRVLRCLYPTAASEGASSCPGLGRGTLARSEVHEDAP
uniref:Uncharacterized protein n=1 Tax=Molossus molossus TaxID=27622 RepID=A0A7J8GLY6_MOLMO|nr:hypothetical protein HJG59_011509 [Molossus molossus]